MPRREHRDADSRTEAVNGKCSTQETSTGAKKRRRRNREGKRTARDLLITGSSFSVLADQTQFPDEEAGNTMSSTHSNTSNFGRNRLAAGFARPAAVYDGLSEVAPMSAGESLDSAIEISEDEDMGDSEGGMLLNLQDGRATAPVELSSGDDDDDDDMESGEYSPAHTADHTTASESRITRPQQEVSASTQLRRLTDLSKEELEDQILYAFYYLERDQIDLNRPVVCLQCFTEGHLSTDCPATTNSKKFCFRVKSGSQVKLWISCCVCASKEHLVGDCPHTDYQAAQRWSLSSLDPNQIINLSLENSTRTLEAEAENRGLRPAGLQIKGRAGRHQAGRSIKFDTESSEDDNNFLHARRNDRRDMPPRYDRFNAPSSTGGRKGGPGRDGFYATDSFGRQRVRSCSPPEIRDGFPRGRLPPRPNAGGGGGDRWQPNPKQSNKPLAPLPTGSDPATSTAPSMTSHAPTAPAPAPRPNIQIQLPNRRDSNPHLDPHKNGTIDKSAVLTRSMISDPSLSLGMPKKRARRKNKAGKNQGNSSNGQ